MARPPIDGYESGRPKLEGYESGRPVLPQEEWAARFLQPPTQEDRDRVRSLLEAGE